MCLVGLLKPFNAEELLAKPDLSISKIAILSGFTSTSAFIRMFKQFKNCTPTDFRELRQNYTFGKNAYISGDSETY